MLLCYIVCHAIIQSNANMHQYQLTSCSSNANTIQLRIFNQHQHTAVCHCNCSWEEGENDCVMLHRIPIQVMTQSKIKHELIPTHILFGQNQEVTIPYIQSTSTQSHVCHRHCSVFEQQVNTQSRWCYGDIMTHLNSNKHQYQRTRCSSTANTIPLHTFKMVSLPLQL